MDKNHITELLPEYLDKALDDVQTQRVEAHLVQCSTCTKEMEELKVLFQAFDDESSSAPSDALCADFFNKIEVEKQDNPKVILVNATERKNYNWGQNLLKIAASLALLIGSYFLGKQQQEQVSNKEIVQLTEEKSEFKQTAMLSLMENKSASRRIQGVNYLNGNNKPDDAILNALAKRMLQDENVNVRAAAVEVLANFTSSEHVKNTFIKALKIENDPGIQIAIIQILGNIQEKKAAGPMRQLMEKEGTQPFVKKQIESILPNII